MTTLASLKMPAVLLSILSLLLSCSGPPPDTNVIVITLDTMRADHLGALNPAAPAATPNLDFLTQKGRLYKNAYSPIAITLPAHAALFYSRLPHDLNLYNNGQIFNPMPDWRSLAQIFQDKGFRTAAFVSLGVLASRFGLNQGFQDYVDKPHPRRWYLTAGELNRRIFAWLDEHAHSSFFLWVHYSDPHDPYAPPAESPDLQFIINETVLYSIPARYRETLTCEIPLKPGRNRLRIQGLNPFPSPRDEFRYSLNDITISPEESLDVRVLKGTMFFREEGNILAVKEEALLEIDNPESLPACVLEAQGNINFFPSEMKQGYCREVEYMDHHIGFLLERLHEMGLMGKTVIALAGDHGEGLGDFIEHKNEYYFGHIHYLKSVYTHIPLIIYDPLDKNPGRHIETPVTLLDIAPAIVTRMRWPTPSFYQGRSLFNSGSAPDRLLFQETHAPEAETDRFAGIDYPWQLIFVPESSEFQLFRLDGDPVSGEDLYSQWKNNPGVVNLTRQLVEKSLRILKNKKDVEIDPDSLEMLKSLGYIK